MVAKSTHILHNTMKPSTKQAAVEHEACARRKRGPELRPERPGPWSQNQGTRTKQQIQVAIGLSTIPYTRHMYSAICTVTIPGPVAS